jgi:hypothetical protein
MAWGVWSMAEMVQCLSSKCEALSLNPSNTKIKKKKTFFMIKVISFQTFKMVHKNRIKDQTGKIILLDKEKAFDKIQHPFMRNTLKKLGIEGMNFNLLKSIYDKLIDNINLNGEN